MDSSSPTSLLLPPMHDLKRPEHDSPPPLTGGVVFDSSVMQRQAKIPGEFIWPQSERTLQTLDELDAPVVDLSGFLRGDEQSTGHAADVVRHACRTHGFFQVVNHGVDAALVRGALQCMETFFRMPHVQKLRGRKKPGSVWGYVGAHSDRFSSRLPWKETLSFGYGDTTTTVNGCKKKPMVVDYFASVFGTEFEQMGWVYERYCKAMMDLSLSIMELLGISLGVDRSCYRELFEDSSSSIMRCNYYPICQEPDLTLGTGPHCDPTTLTILQQDHVGGLEVFTADKWHSVSPVRDALVINIGDTFTALSNGKYKSCLHRAVVNRHRARRSLAFFLCPREDRVVRPPEELLERDGGERRFPDFTWEELLGFTQRHYRADMRTLQRFTQWLVGGRKGSSPSTSRTTC